MSRVHALAALLLLGLGACLSDDVEDIEGPDEAVTEQRIDLGPFALFSVQTLGFVIDVPGVADSGKTIRLVSAEAGTWSFVDSHMIYRRQTGGEHCAEPTSDALDARVLLQNCSAVAPRQRWSVLVGPSTIRMVNKVTGFAIESTGRDNPLRMRVNQPELSAQLFRRILPLPPQ